MSFIGRKEVVSEGDTVILFFSVSSINAVEVRPTVLGKHGHPVPNIYNSPYGRLPVMDLVGKKYGSKIDFPKGWAHLLRPTCELWTKALPHRTQIIYTPDISMILLGLDLKPGSIVYEAGTGSGSLSHAIIRAVQSTGHLYTFDFHEQRSLLARDEFQKHGLNQWVSTGHRDVISDGFPNSVEEVDAVFLDLPNPWDAVLHVERALKRGGKFCTFSPCIEQVQKTCEALRRTRSFILINTHEVLQRPYAVHTKTINSLNFIPTSETNKDLKLDPISRNPIKLKTLVPPLQTQGHTGYLTFATFVSRPPDDQ